MGQGPHSWLVARLDGFLSESLLVQLRRSSSTRTLALLLCSLLTAGTIASTLHLKSLTVATHASVMLVPVVSVYLLGSRLGLLFSVLASVNVGLVFPLLTWGSLRSPDQALCLFAAFYVLCAWAVGWLFVSARDAIQDRVEWMVRTLRASEGKLVSLIESTDDMVLALDAEERVVTANEAARQLFRRVSGRELSPGEFAFGVSTPEEREFWSGLLTRALRGERVRLEKLILVEGGALTVDLIISPVWGEGQRVVGTTLFGRDITARKLAEARLSEMHRNLLEVSRQAGMAEIATGVLHNVGNALNSVNVSAGLVTERLRGLHVGSMTRAVALMDEHEEDLGSFLTTDPRGRQLPAYLKALSRQLVNERESVMAEVRTLCESVEHIKAVVCMQQRHACSSGMMELLPVPELLDDALRLHAISFERVGIQVRREYVAVPPVWGDRHKLLQILINLLNNARHALLDSDSPDKQLTLRVRPGTGARLHIEVADNGVGVTPENMTRLFTQGFTTKKEGHGFGLHISALAAEEMQGSLSCVSDGSGQGATFILELPAGEAPPHLEPVDKLQLRAPVPDGRVH